MINTAIRKTLKDKQIKQWELANALNVSESTLIRWLRSPLSEDKEKELLQKIDEIHRQKGDNAE